MRCPVEEIDREFVLPLEGFICSEVRGDSRCDAAFARLPTPAGLVEMIASFGFPLPTGEFELRCTRVRREGFELHPPNGRVVSRSEIVRFYTAKESEQ